MFAQEQRVILGMFYVYYYCLLPSLCANK